MLLVLLLAVLLAVLLERSLEHRITELHQWNYTRVIRPSQAGMC